MIDQTRVHCDEYVVIQTRLRKAEDDIEWAVVGDPDYAGLRDALEFADSESSTSGADPVEAAREMICEHFSALLHRYTRGLYAQRVEAEATRNLRDRLRWCIGETLSIQTRPRREVEFLLRLDQVEALLNFLDNNDIMESERFMIDVGIRYYCFNSWRLKPRPSAEPVRLEDIHAGLVVLVRAADA